MVDERLLNGMEELFTAGRRRYGGGGGSSGSDIFVFWGLVSLWTVRKRMGDYSYCIGTYGRYVK